MNEDVLLIETIQLYPWLYDKSRSDYKDNNKKNNAWEAIADAMSLTGIVVVEVEICILQMLKFTVEEVQRRCRILREKYSKERRLIKCVASGSSSEPLKSSWDLHESMKFMEKHIATRK